jgi:hypothetical protein
MWWRYNNIWINLNQYSRIIVSDVKLCISFMKTDDECDIINFSRLSDVHNARDEINELITN